MILRKMPSGKILKIYGPLKDGKKVLHIMKKCFKKHELREDIELHQDRVCSLAPDVGAQIQLLEAHTKDKGYRWKVLDLVIRDLDDITITHELVHAYRYKRYGHLNPKSHNEEDVEQEAIRRLRER